MSSLLGVSLGILIGIISAVVMIKFLILLDNTDRQSKVMIIIGELLAIPTFWFGGPWLTTSFLKGVNLNDIFEDYISSLVVTFLLLCSYSLTRYIIKSGNNIGIHNKIGKNEGDSDV